MRGRSCRYRFIAVAINGKGRGLAKSSGAPRSIQAAALAVAASAWIVDFGSILFWHRTTSVTWVGTSLASEFLPLMVCRRGGNPYTGQQSQTHHKAGKSAHFVVWIDVI